LPRATSVGVVGPLPSAGQQVFQGWNYRIAHATEAALAKQDFHVSLLSTPAGTLDFDRVRTRLDHLGADLAGVICLRLAGMQEMLDELDRRNIPWVTINRANDHYVHNFVTADNLQGGEMVGQLFARLGFGHVLMLGRPLVTGGSESEKYFGFMRGYLEGGQSTRNVDFVVCADWNEPSGYDAMKAHTERYGAPRGVFCVGDLLALGAIRYCREHNLAVPGDVGVIGATGLDVAAYAHPSLTVLQQPMEAMGIEAARMLLEMVREETRRLVGRFVPSPLIPRESLPIDAELLRQLAPGPKR
jgi:DNA-binding LacI/PurR family transcriptional regulator